MPGYKKPCRYCGKLAPPDANNCPFCGKAGPFMQRCPGCRSPVEAGWKTCSHCGLPLVTSCPACGAETLFDEHCQACGARLTVVCPNPKCRTAQPPLGPNCVACGKPLKRGG